MDETYRTVDGRGRVRFEVRGSEFIGHVAPAATVEEAEEFVAAVSEEHADATHNVPAYRVRADPFREYASDDAEPSGSAGKPALNVLQQRDVENAVAVVTRYYGGTDLGVGGLARSYSKAVTDGVDDAGVVEAVPQETFAVTVAYDDSGSVRGLLESAGVEFEAAYEADVRFDVRAPASEGADLRDRLRSATRGRASIEMD